MQAEFAKATVNVNISSDSAATLHTAQLAKIVRNSATRFCNVRTSLRHSHCTRAGEDWYPFNTNIFQQQPDAQHSQASRTLKQARTFKQYSQANKIYKQELSSMNSQVRTRNTDSQARPRKSKDRNREQFHQMMINILAFYNV